MTVTQAAPLPECEQCGRPTRRAVYAATGGLCTPCAAWDTAAAVTTPQAADDGVQQLREWQDTVRRIRRAEAVAAAARARRRLARREQERQRRRG